MDRKIRVGVVGLGKMGILHSALLNVISGVELAALCDKNRMIVKYARKIVPKVPVVEHIRKLKEMDLDAVFVTTPIPTHLSVIRDIYLRDVCKHVFVEKTLASTYKESVELCQLAKAAGGVAMVGYQKRFAVTFRKLSELLAHGVLGRVEGFHAYAYSSDFIGLNDSAGDRRGGVLRDLGSHVVDLALNLFGDMEVCASHVTSMDRAGLRRLWQFKTLSNGGFYGQFSVSWSMPGYRLPEVGLSIFGSSGSVRASDDMIELTVDGEISRWFKQSLQDNVAFLLGQPEYFREDLSFIRCIQGGQIPDVDFDSGSRVDRIIAEVELKAETRSI